MSPYRVPDPPSPEPKEKFRKRHPTWIGAMPIVAGFLLTQVLLHAWFRYDPLTNNGVPCGQVTTFITAAMLGFFTTIGGGVAVSLFASALRHTAEEVGKRINEFLDKR